MGKGTRAERDAILARAEIVIGGWPYPKDLRARAPRLLGPLVRHGRAVSLVGGLLVVAIGLAMFFDLLSLLPRYFQFNTAI